MVRQASRGRWACRVSAAVLWAAVAAPLVLANPEDVASFRPVDRQLMRRESRRGEGGAAAVQLPGALSSTPDAAWSETSLWVRGNGGAADPQVQGRTYSHGGVKVRGVIAGAGGFRSNGNALLTVPRKQWVHLDNFPDVRDAALSQLPFCRGMANGSEELLRLSAVLAVEAQKKNHSWYNLYLRQLPTLEEYTEAHPHFADGSVMDDFGSLPPMKLVRHMQQYDRALRDCFESWQNASSEVHVTIPKHLQDVRWEDMQLAMVHTRTRRHVVDTGLTGSSGSAVIPGLDMLNTAARHDVNTRWTAGEKEFQLMPRRDVQPGAELYSEYCGRCDNSKLLLLWGFVLDNNPNTLQPLSPSALTAACGPVGTAAVAAAAAQTRPVLSDVVLGTFALDRGALPEAPADVFRRLVSEGRHRAGSALGCPFAAEAKGPMRCSLARLALEQCAEAWAKGEAPDKGTVGVGMLLQEGEREEESFAGLSLREAAEAVYSSAISGVHPSLLQQG